MPSAIETNKLTKYYRRGRVLGVKNLNLDVRAGEIFGFLGPNGAGKSTTIRLLLDLIRPTEGSAKVLGLDPKKDAVALHKQVGYIPGEIFLPANQTGQECVTFYSRLRGEVDAKYLRRLVDQLELDLKKRVGTYSKGNRQKLAIVLALMSQPPLLLLDEPTSGLDPLNQQVFYELIRETRAWEATVFFSTHILSEANLMCDRVGIIKAGQIVATEDIDAIRQKNIRHVHILTNSKIAKSDLKLPGVKKITLTETGAQLVTVGHLGQLIERLAKMKVDDITVSEPSLDDLFMKYYQ